MDANAPTDGRLLVLLRAWFAMLIALYIATILTLVGWTEISEIWDHHGVSLNDVGRILSGFGLSALFAIPLALVFSILALPFLILRRFIIEPDPPYVRPGYVVVVLFGPAISSLLLGQSADTAWLFVIPYEATTLVATAIYVCLIPLLELSDAEA